MTLKTVSSDEFEPRDDQDSLVRQHGVARRTDQRAASGGIYSLPGVGPAASRTHQFFVEMAPTEADSTEVRVAKEIFRWSSAAAGAAAVAIVVL